MNHYSRKEAGGQKGTWFIKTGAYSMI